jgi:hypothetical protein
MTSPEKGRNRELIVIREDGGRRVMSVAWIRLEGLREDPKSNPKEGKKNRNADEDRRANFPRSAFATPGQGDLLSSHESFQAASQRVSEHSSLPSCHFPFNLDTTHDVRPRKLIERYTASLRPWRLSPRKTRRQVRRPVRSFTKTRIRSIFYSLAST